MPVKRINREKAIRILAIVLLMVAAAEFAIRGPIRFVRSQAGWNDFLSPYVQADAWIHGKDPYSASSVVLFWPSEKFLPEFIGRESADGSLPARHGIPSLYPLTTLVLIAPFVGLKWSSAEFVWIVVNTSVLLLALAALVEISEAEWSSPRVKLFLAVALGLAPLHTGLANGNPAVLAIAFTILALWASRNERGGLGGTLLALALCLKPTIAIALLLYYVLCRQWRIVAVSSAVAGLIAALAAGRLAIARAAWVSSYLENNAKILAPGGLADFTSGDPLRFNLVNTQVLFYSLSGSLGWARWTPLLLTTGLFAIWIYFWLRLRQLSGQPDKNELLEVSALFLLSLLPVYHRFYDAGLLLFPVAWACLVAKSRSCHIWTALALAPFLVPGAAVLDHWKEQGRIPVALEHSYWWNTVVMPHEIWALLAWSILLLRLMANAAMDTVVP